MSCFVHVFLQITVQIEGTESLDFTRANTTCCFTSEWYRKRYNGKQRVDKLKKMFGKSRLSNAMGSTLLVSILVHSSGFNVLVDKTSQNAKILGYGLVESLETLYPGRSGDWRPYDVSRSTRLGLCVLFLSELRMNHLLHETLEQKLPCSLTEAPIRSAYVSPQLQVNG